MNNFRRVDVKYNTYLIDCEKLYNFEDLRKDLIDEIERDTIENRDDIDIVKENLKLLDKIHSRQCGYNEKFIIEELQAFGVEIDKVSDIQNGLISFRDYLEFNQNGDSNRVLIYKINDVLCSIKEYLEECKYENK